MSGHPDNGEMKRFGRGRTHVDKVWIVMDESVDGPELILGVFANPDDANQFFKSLAPDRPDGTIALAQYAVGWTYYSGSQTYRS